MRSRQRTPEEIFNLTPMIDVVLQLIIFFMFSSQFAQMSRAQVKLPEQPGEQEAARSTPRTFVIDITDKGEYTIDRERMSIDRVAQLVRAQVQRNQGDASRLDLLIRADRTASASAVNALAERFLTMEVRGWRLATVEVSPLKGANP